MLYSGQSIPEVETVRYSDRGTSGERNFSEDPFDDRIDANLTIIVGVYVGVCFVYIVKEIGGPERDHDTVADIGITHKIPQYPVKSPVFRVLGIGVAKVDHGIKNLYAAAQKIVIFVLGNSHFETALTQLIRKTLKPLLRRRLVRGNKEQDTAA